MSTGAYKFISLKVHMLTQYSLWIIWTNRNQTLETALKKYVECNVEK